MSKPYVKNDKFLGDVINSILLRPPYRKPLPSAETVTEQKQEAKEAPAEQSASQTVAGAVAEEQTTNAPPEAPAEQESGSSDFTHSILISPEWEKILKPGSYGVVGSHGEVVGVIESGEKLDATNVKVFTSFAQVTSSSPTGLTMNLRKLLRDTTRARNTAKIAKALGKYTNARREIVVGTSGKGKKSKRAWTADPTKPILIRQPSVDWEQITRERSGIHETPIFPTSDSTIYKVASPKDGINVSYGVVGTKGGSSSYEKLSPKGGMKGTEKVSPKDGSTGSNWFVGKDRGNPPTPKK